PLTPPAARTVRRSIWRIVQPIQPRELLRGQRSRGERHSVHSDWRNLRRRSKYESDVLSGAQRIIRPTDLNQPTERTPCLPIRLPLPVLAEISEFGGRSGITFQGGDSFRSQPIRALSSPSPRPSR